MAVGIRHISHSGHAHLRCIKCNIVAAIQRRCSRPGRIPGHQQLATPRTSSPPGTTYPRPPNPVLHLMQLSPEHKPGHHPPAAPSPAPSRRQASNELQPATAFRITVYKTQLRRPLPGAIGDLDPDDAVPGNDHDRDRLPGSTRTGVPDTITEDLADQQRGVIPAWMPGAEHLTDERAGDPRPLRPPGKRHALPDRRPGHHRTALPRPPRPGKPAGQRADAGICTLSSAANVKPAQRAPRGPRPWLVRGRGPRPWPSVKQPTVRTDRPNGTQARPLCVRGHRNMTVYSATR